MGEEALNQNFDRQSGAGSPILEDQVIWEGDILAIQLFKNPEDDQLYIFATEGFLVPDDSLEFDGAPAVLSFSRAMEDPDAARATIQEQIQNNIIIRGGNRIAADHIAGLADTIFSQFYLTYKDKNPEIEVSADQQRMFFQNLEKVPEVLRRVLDQENIQIVVDNSGQLSGSAPAHYTEDGLFLDGNIYVSHPYEPQTIVEETVHFIDKKLGFSDQPAYDQAVRPLTNQPDLLHVMGFMLNKNYKPGAETYETSDAGEFGSELLVDMFAIRHALTETEMDYVDKTILGLEPDSPDMTRIQGLRHLYENVVKGKTVEEIEAYYDEKVDPLLGQLRYADTVGRELTLSMAQVPKDQIESILANENNPEGLLDAIFSSEMQGQLDSFEAQISQRYPDMTLEPGLNQGVKADITSP